MDKNAIKKYAVWARRELISRVSQRAALYEITDKGYGDASADSVLGRVMSAEEKRQRQALITQIREKGYEQAMEEIAYTWFNRFIALRFMEVNGYLPSRVRVFTDDENNFKPQILTEAINMELDGLDMEKVYALKNANDDDALFKYMIIVQCNALSGILPGMFQRISDYTELLFPDNLLREGSVIEQMVSMIPEEDWTDQVQIIGWLYQYYNTEPKDKVFADLKKNIKISKENIPAATQLFTPDWIVRYMVENSLGRLWLEGHPNDELKATWKYYLDEAEQEPDVQTKLAEIRKEYAILKPEDILAIDPCQGSGHILAYMFDVLVQIYESYGYTAREAAASIVEHNIWGLDIDDRAAQLAYFSVMMKARQYDRRFFSRRIQPHVFAIPASNNIDEPCIDYFAGGNESVKKALTQVLNALRDAKEYGSILDMPEVDFSLLYQRFDEIKEQSELNIFTSTVFDMLLPLVEVAQMLAQKYHVTITNPPYMSSSGMGEKLNSYVRENYPDSKADLFAVFIEKLEKMLIHGGYQAMITQHSWMFLSSYEKLRQKLRGEDFVSMAHLGSRAFEEIGGEVVQTSSFVFRRTHIESYIGTYCRLVAPTTQQGKEDLFLSGNNRYYAKQSLFPKIPGEPIAYWANQQLYDAFENGELLESIAHPRKGLATTDNNRFLRLWFEVDICKCGFGYKTAAEAKTSGRKWFPLNKGGEFRRWYGNKEYLVNWENDGKEMKDAIVKRYNGGSYTKEIRSESRYFSDSITWSALTAGASSFRYSDYGALFDSAGSSMFPVQNTVLLLAFLNSKVADAILRIINPTMNYGAGSIANLPIVFPTEKAGIIESITKDCISLSKADWDSFETSWDFEGNPLCMAYEREKGRGKEITLRDAFEIWRDESDLRFERLKSNEEQLNQCFISLYGLQDEILPTVASSEVSVRKADLKRDIKNLISYAVGCMFGRYSLDSKGLAYAGGGWPAQKYSTFLPDKDSIIPICDDEYFEDDIVGRFIDFLGAAFGKANFADNLLFIAETLGGNASPREILRSYFINDFYGDHLRMYQKRPIYWLFDSGKKNGFKCLVYMHRYMPDTIARIRTDYVHEQQSRYRTAIADLESRIVHAGTSERVKLSKQLTKLKEQTDELRVYEEKIHHLADQMLRIDLDDGVKHNYALFQDVLAKLK